MTAEDTRPLPSDPWPNRAALLSPDLGSEPDSPSRPRLDWPDPEPVEVVTQGQDWCEYSDGSVDLYPPRFGRPPDDQPPPIGRNYRNDPLRQARGNLPRPPEVWEAARNDYLAGHSAADVCRRYGLRLGTFRHRAAADGWRRADQPVPDLSQVQADTVAPMTMSST
ncbi:MAG: hypothetical protein HZY74_03900 [Brevundimonas sp.]|nr:MAG: hypothetical protein HZY74_03900 [Brevundimonas sp.]